MTWQINPLAIIAIIFMAGVAYASIHMAIRQIPRLEKALAKLEVRERRHYAKVLSILSAITVADNPGLLEVKPMVDQAIAHSANHDEESESEELP